MEGGFGTQGAGWLCLRRQDLVVPVVKSSEAEGLKAAANQTRIRFGCIRANESRFFRIGGPESLFSVRYSGAVNPVSDRVYRWQGKNKTAALSELMVMMRCPGLNTCPWSENRVFWAGKRGHGWL